MPRANFECKKCAKVNAVTEVVYEDLPLESVRCPVCGAKRGFKRLFDAINVASESHARTMLTDKLVEPQWQQFHEQRESAKKLEEESRKAGMGDAMRIPYKQLVTSTGGHTASRNYGVPVLQALGQRKFAPRALVTASHNPKPR
jgi:transcription elongation factor Elf1